MHFAAALPALVFQPSDPDPVARASIDAWVAATGLSNVLPPIALDAAEEEWPQIQPDAVVCINMIHIAPWRAAEGLVRGVGRALRPGGVLYLYGPYRRAGRHARARATRRSMTHCSARIRNGGSAISNQ